MVRAKRATSENSSKLFSAFTENGLPDIWGKYQNYLRDKTFNISSTPFKHFPRYWDDVIEKALKIPIVYDYMENLEEAGMKKALESAL